MRKCIFLFATLFIGLSISDNALAQLNRREIKKNNKKIRRFRGFKEKFAKSKRYDFIAFSVNSLNYFGDLSPAANAVSTDISFTRPGFTILWGHRFGPRYTFRAGFTWGTLRGDDFKSADPLDVDARFRYVRNLHFRNRIKELSVTAMFDLLENMSTHINRVSWTPYAFGGLAVFHHNPKAQVPEVDVHNNNEPFENAGEWVPLQPLGTEGQNSDIYDRDLYKRVQIAIPFGIGLRYRLDNAWDFSVEIGLRYLFTDYIDDVSTRYVDLGTFEDPLARALSDRSREPNAVFSGDARNFDVINEITAIQTYTGADGNDYTVFNGFGSDLNEFNIRGKENNNDIFIVTSLKLSYILKGSFRKAKFR